MNASIISIEAYHSYLECYSLLSTEDLRQERVALIQNTTRPLPGAHAERAQDMLIAITDLLINREDTECVEVQDN